MPIGAIGELYISGMGLARGYLNQPDLTAETFIANPFRTKEDLSLARNYRLYKTGDLIRWLPDGSLEYIGRNDLQVKIRGLRVELGEIESILQGHEDVVQAIVLVVLENDGNKRLVAYVVPTDRFCFSSTSDSTSDSTIDSSTDNSFSILNGESINILTKELKTYLSCSLSDYMIPKTFVYLDRIPLAPTGKTNRSSLSLIASPMTKNKVFIHPINEIQFTLVKIWREVLKIDNLSIDHDFFEVGGNSILAIKLASYIKRQFYKEITVSDIYKNSTVYKQSLLLTAVMSQKIYDSSVFSIKEGQGVPLFMIHPGGGLAFCYMGLTHYLDMPVYGINNPSFAEPEGGLNSVGEIAEHYIRLIKTVQKTGPYYLGGWSFGGFAALEMARLLCLQNQEVKRLILIDVVNPRQIGDKPTEIEGVIKELQEEKNSILKQVIGDEMFDIMQRNIVFLGHKMYEHVTLKYEGETVLLVAKDDAYTIDDYGWKNVLPNLRTIDIPGTHETLFDDFVHTTSEALKQALEPGLFSKQFIELKKKFYE